MRQTLRNAIAAGIVVAAALLCGCRRAGPELHLEHCDGLLVIIIRSDVDAEQGKSAPVEVVTDAEVPFLP